MGSGQHLRHHRPWLYAIHYLLTLYRIVVTVAGPGAARAPRPSSRYPGASVRRAETGGGVAPHGGRCGRAWGPRSAPPATVTVMCDGVLPAAFCLLLSDSWGAGVSEVVTGVILAGGKSRRMGQDKRRLAWGETTLLGHVVATLRPVVGELLVVVDDARRVRHLDARVIEDLVPGTHALGGLYTGLTLASRDRCFVCACDAPLLQPALIRFLCEQAEGFDLAIPQTDRGLQPLHAVYAKSVLPAIEEQLQRRQFNLHTLVTKVRANVVPLDRLRPFDPAGLSFLNVNTPQEYEVARERDRERVGDVRQAARILQP